MGPCTNLGNMLLLISEKSSACISFRLARFKLAYMSSISKALSQLIAPTQVVSSSYLFGSLLNCPALIYDCLCDCENCFDWSLLSHPVFELEVKLMSCEAPMRLWQVKQQGASIPQLALSFKPIAMCRSKLHIRHLGSHLAQHRSAFRAPWQICMYIYILLTQY